MSRRPFHQNFYSVEKDRRFESVYSNKIRAGKRRTYFFDVRKTKGDDFYLTLTESTKKFHGDRYERHKIFLYKEDFNRFLAGLEDAINHVKTELLPDYDFEEFDRRQEEWEARRAEEEAAGGGYQGNQGKTDSGDSDSSGDSGEEVEEEDDMSW